MATLSLPHQIKTGIGSVKQIGEVVKANGASRVLVIMDSFLAQSPLNISEKVGDALKQDGIDFALFSDYAGEPTTAHVNKALDTLQDFNADCVIAVGGGSAIDISKAVSLFALNPEMAWDKITLHSRLNCLPLIAVPTTAGTGSEATKVMVITNAETDYKMNPGHHSLIPDAAILDPELTVSLPENFTAFTGLDALTHAIEAYVSNKASRMTDLYALKAIQMIGKSLPVVYENSADLKERENMLLASCYAGIAFSNSSTNLAHAAARPLGARFHIPHGLSVALLLPFVIRFGLESAEDRYADIAIALGADADSSSIHTSEAAVEITEVFNRQFKIWEAGENFIKKIDDWDHEVKLLVNDALSGNGIQTNRRKPTAKDIEDIYQSLFHRLGEKVV
ncbi:alcohol dehydrogenase [Lentibacillus kapialis]|uniref:Alcohol dehydrogenase n=1 Tax=Lentibacillus kapialis TaxID=340214 RepID=A0A917Q2Z0_9BACI|nr:iron-containing alcohol dehydrogenase [Lentibacillus kapialis]GGK08675.1 alcohol dehydrogenase [Lentibacillus kapialis]